MLEYVQKKRRTWISYRKKSKRGSDLCVGSGSYTVGQVVSYVLALGLNCSINKNKRHEGKTQAQGILR